MSEMSDDLEDYAAVCGLKNKPYEPIIWELLLKKWAQKNYTGRGDKSKEVAVKQSVGNGKIQLPVMDFSKALASAFDVFKDQALMSKDPSKINNKDIELNRAKAASFFEGVHNILQLGHLKELVEQDEHRFKREEELKALKPLLESFQLAAISGQRSMMFIADEMEKLLQEEDVPMDYSSVIDRPLKKKKKKSSDDEDGEFDEITITQPSKIECMAWLQNAYATSIENLVKITGGLSKVIQLERFSGGRNWGLDKSGARKSQLELPPPPDSNGGQDKDEEKIKDIKDEELIGLQIDTEEIAEEDVDVPDEVPAIKKNRPKEISDRF